MILVLIIITVTVNNKEKCNVNHVSIHKQFEFLPSGIRLRIFRSKLVTVKKTPSFIFLKVYSTPVTVHLDDFVYKTCQ